MNRLEVDPDNPCVLFPEEIWGLILDHLADSKDVKNALIAYPTLDNSTSLQNRKKFWFIGQVVRQLTFLRLIKEADVLQCRKVCKQWARQIDNFLENQVSLNPYRTDCESSHGQNVEQLWDPERYLDRYDNDNEADEEDQLEETDDELDEVVMAEAKQKYLRRKKEILGNITFHAKFTDMARINSEMEEHFAYGRNPFFGRSLTISFYDRHDNLKEEFWEGVSTCLERFGKHIWYVKIKISKRYRVDNCVGSMSLKIDDFWRTLSSDVLPYLPQLKSLHIETGDSVFRRTSKFEGSCSMKKDDDKENICHIFQNLESIICDSNDLSESKWMRTLVSYHSIMRLRRLELPHQFFKERVLKSSGFPNLTELKIVQIASPLGRVCSKPDMLGLYRILQLLNAPELAKLHFQFKLGNPMVLNMEKDIFMWIQRFPKIRYLNFGDNCRRIKLSDTGKILYDCPAIHYPFFPFIEFFSLRDSLNLSYNYLFCFPLLKYLQIYIRPEPKVIDCSILDSDIKILEQIQTGKLYESNIWELFPHLKSVTLLQEDMSNGELEDFYKFDRATYEQLKIANKRKERVTRRTGGGVKGEPNFSNLRSDILAFLGLCDESDESSEVSTSGSDKSDSENEEGHGWGAWY